MKNILLGLSILLITSCGNTDHAKEGTTEVGEVGNVGTEVGSSLNNNGHDDKHITFINQTKHKIKFEVDISLRPNKSKTLKSHSANYISIVDCKSKTFKIQFKDEDTGNILKDHNGDELIRHRKCGENIYLWETDSGRYQTGNEPNISADISGCDNNSSKPAVLFVHGYNATQKNWDHFATLAKQKNWRVFRTSVSEDGSIKKRAHMLNSYIVKAANECSINDGSLRVIAHSMGGLDIRYLISYHLESSNKIERIYTIATPHKGDGYAYFADVASDAGRDLTVKHMTKFNNANLYSNFNDKSGRYIHLLAMRFACAKYPNTGDSDIVVEVKDQSYPDAPYSQKIYHGKHMNKAICIHGYEAEQEQDWLLKDLLRDHKDGNFTIDYID